MAQLVDVIQAAGTACEIYSHNEDTELVNDTKFLLSEIALIERSSHPILYLSVSDNNQRLTYLSSSSWEGEEDYLDGMEDLAENSDILIFGAHGPVVKNNCNFYINLERVQKYIVFDQSHLGYIFYNDELLVNAYNAERKVFVGPGTAKIDFGDNN